MESFIYLIALLILLMVAGAICGLISLSRVGDLSRRLGELEIQMKVLRRHLRGEQESPPSRPADQVAEEPPPAEKISGPVPETPVQGAPFPAPVLSPPHTKAKVVSPSPGPHSLSLEVKLGTRWLNWVGMVMMLVGVGFFLRYAYDNAWIGPTGRLAIGTLLGVAALAVGERFRRRNWDILFQVLTGGGIAAFYLCVFFSFQVYHLSDQPLSMVLAILVTALAVVMAVAHDAVSIALLGLIGGFLSPVLLSTGINHP